jgi:hypothetical protein
MENNMHATSQSQAIKSYLMEDGTRKLTPLSAFKLFGCFRLGARIYDINKTMPAGYHICSRMIKVFNMQTGKTKRVAEYQLEFVNIPAEGNK